MEMLLAALQATSNKAESQAQQHVGQDRTQDGGTNDWDICVTLTRLEQYHKEHNLDDGAKGSFDQDTEDLGNLASEFGTSEADHVGGRDHCDVVGNEDGEVHFRAREMLHSR